MKRILVIDDDLETCNFLTEIFAEEGWEVDSSQSAEAARDAVHDRYHDRHEPERDGERPPRHRVSRPGARRSAGCNPDCS